MVRRMVYSKGGHSMRNRVNRLMKLVSLKMKRDEGPAPGSTWIFFLGFAPSSILAAANYSRCHNWRIIALKSKGWSLEELNRHSKATQFLLSISWIQIRVPLKPHNCCILAELSTRTRDKR